MPRQFKTGLNSMGRRWRGFFMGGVLLVLDQITKHWFAKQGDVVQNPGIFLGLLPSQYWQFILVAVLLFVGWYLTRISSRRVFWGFALIWIGGFSNLVDRWLYGAVRDFIHYPLLGITGNVADIYLAVGVSLLIYDEFRKPRQQKEMR